MNSYERKLRKKAHKLAKWAKKHGIEHVAMCVSGPDDADKRWWADVTAYVGDVRVVSTYTFYKEDEL